ncbi:MAG TPA: periplasmic heavy metal sensor [Stellaceae bacterium]
MASASSTAGTGSPRRHLFATLMAISVALNLFFIAGAVWTRLNGPPAALGSDDRYGEMAAELKLDAQQRAAFDRYVAAMRSRVEEMRQQIDPLIGNAWEEIAKPQADANQVMAAFDQASEKRRAFQRELTSQTIAFLSVLSPDQRKSFVSIVRDHRAPWFHARRPAH